MNKKVISAMLAASMAVSLAACGSTATSEAASSEASSAVSSETSSTVASGESAASGSYTGTPIKVGGIGPITGAAATYGNAVKNAEELAVKEINAANGSDVFDWKFEDDEHDAEKSVNAYNSLKDWGMQVLAGPVTTTPTLAVAAESVNDNMFVMTPSASAQTVIETGDNVFQICFTDSNQGSRSAQYIDENFDSPKIAIIYKNDDQYSIGIRDNFKAEADSRGMDIVYEGTFTEASQTDFNVQLAGAQSAGADLLFLPIYYTPASVILTQANAMGYAPTFFGVDGMDGILTMEGFDPSLAEGLMLLTPFSATVPETQSFVEAYTAANDGVTPNQFAADGYDCIYAIYEACQAAGITADREKCRHNLHNSLMLVTALNPYIGYDNAAKTAKKAYKENISLKEACVALGFLTAEKFDEVFRPEEMV